MASLFFPVHVVTGTVPGPVLWTASSIRPFHNLGRYSSSMRESNNGSHWYITSRVSVLSRKRTTVCGRLARRSAPEVRRLLWTAEDPHVARRPSSHDELAGARRECLLQHRRRAAAHALLTTVAAEARIADDLVERGDAHRGLENRWCTQFHLR